MAKEDFIYGKDIAEALLEDMDEIATISGGDYVSQAKRYVRKAYWDLLTRYQWPWAMSTTPGTIVTEPAVSISVQSISGANVTLTASIATSKAGFKFYLDSNNSVYRVLSHVAGTAALVLDAAYVETGTGTGKLYKDEYVVVDANVLKIWSPFQVRGQWWQPLEIITKDQFESIYGKGWSAGPAPFEKATEIWYDTNGVKQYRFAPWSEESVVLEYDYTKLHDLDFSGGSTDIPKVPREFRHAIIDLALYNGFVAKEDSRAVDKRVEVENTIQEMINTFFTPEHAQFYVRPRNSLSLGLS